MTGPVYVDWAITNRCNLSCGYCVGMEAAELSRSQALKVAREVIVLAPRWVILEGGEPLLREDLEEIGGMLKGAGIEVFVITNGNAFTPERLHRLASFSPKVLFSIDGADAPTYEGIKAGAKFSVAREWAAKCAELGIFQGITVVLSKLNRKQVRDFLHLSEELGGRQAIFLPLKPSAEDEAAGSYYGQYALTPQEQRGVVKEIYSYPTALDIFYDEPFLWNLAMEDGFSLSHGDSGVTIPDVVGCAASFSMYIQTGGDVRPCMFCPPQLSFGNAAQEPLREIWQRMQGSPVLIDWANQRVRKGACGQCPRFESCRGCLARTYRLTGDVRGADVSCPLGHSYKVRNSG